MPSGLRSLPNLVATTTSSRRSAIARPTRRSLVKGPYMSAVSRKMHPASRACRMTFERLGIVGAAVELTHAHAAEAKGGDGELVVA